ncbi:MAG: Dioxygenase related to 2-nitropropane dioxygenase [Firmicutes bacterium]|nr:Dioxygenase related to 2-nitropropane dioxygenase [Bacillota bacterium]
MTLPSLTIGNKTARHCIIQGGMSIRIALADLVAAVANEGGAGNIGGMGIPPKELRRHIRATRAKTAGLWGVNLMFAGMLFDDLLDVCIEERVDFVTIGAGFARGPFKKLAEAGIPGVCIISSEKAARVAARTAGITAVVIESGQAGGHLGPEDPNISTWDLFPPVLAALRQHGFTGPVIAAGGILHREDIDRALAMGADGVQMGIRFAMTEESSASDAMKVKWLEATGSQVEYWSPTGMASRAITPHTEDQLPKLTQEGVHCAKCLKYCLHRDTEGHTVSHCIYTALNRSQKGDPDHGLVFCGPRVAEIDDIVSVKEVFRRLLTPVASLAETLAD